jgi:hypothetical protein
MVYLRDEYTPLVPDTSTTKAPEPLREAELHSPSLEADDATPYWDATFARLLVHKIDLRLLPIFFITFNFNFIDKTILSSASVFGLTKDVVSPHSSLMKSSLDLWSLTRL